MKSHGFICHPSRARGSRQEQDSPQNQITGLDAVAAD